MRLMLNLVDKGKSNTSFVTSRRRQGLPQMCLYGDYYVYSTSVGTLVMFHRKPYAFHVTLTRGNW